MKEEDLKYIELMPKVRKMAEADPRHGELMQIADRWEAKAKPILNAMDKEERKVLLCYITSRGAVDLGYIEAAYELGRQHGPRKENETLADWVEDPKRWEPLLTDDIILPK